MAKAPFIKPDSRPVKLVSIGLTRCVVGLKNISTTQAIITDIPAHNWNCAAEIKASIVVPIAVPITAINTNGNIGFNGTIPQ